MSKDISKFGYVMLIAFIISSVFNYLYQVVMGVLLPKSQYGILGVALSIFLIASVLTQNTFSWSGTRRMAAAKDEHEIARIFGTVLSGNLSLALIASVIIILLSMRSKSLFLPNVVIAVTIVVSAFVTSFNSLIRAIKKFYVLASANVTISLLRLILSILLVIIGLGALGAVEGMLFSLSIVTILLYCYIRSLRLPKSSRFVRDIISETLYVSITFIGIAFIINSSIIFAKILGCSNALAGDYNASLTIARGTFFITGALITVLFPYVSSEDKRETIAFQSIKYAFLFVLPIAISMAINPKIWLYLFFAAKYLSGAYILRLLSVGIGLASLVSLISSNLVAFNEAKVTAIFLLIGVVVQTAFVSLFKSNPITATATSVIVASLFVLIPMILYYIREHYFKISSSYVVRISIAYLTILIFQVLNPIGRLPALIEIALAFLMYTIVLALLKLFDEKDVVVLLSPLPSRMTRSVMKIIRILNSIG